MQIAQTREKLKNLILETVAKEKPESVEQLKQFLIQYHGLKPDQTADLFFELESDGKLRFSKPLLSQPRDLKGYMLSKSAIWFWGTVAVCVATTILVFAVPENAYPIVYIRSALGIIFVLFLPGYAFIKTLFPTTVPIKTGSEALDTIERIALSFGMSLALVPIIGLILNYTPWGIRLAPITLSLLALTAAFATAGILRERQTATNKTET